ncbi:MAG: photosystem II biogenesis protein Psp29 [Geitlerinemataceae cyanobacterium]
MDKVPTVSDTKRSFYKTHSRPINSIYRRVVEELMVEMHLLGVNVDFQYDSIYALGVVSSFDRFMSGYRPEADKASIFQALCQALGKDPQQYRRDAQSLESWATQVSPSTALGVLGLENSSEESREVEATVRAIAANPHFKYSRLFAIGLYSLLELADADFVKENSKLEEILKPISKALNLSAEKLQKDLELYRSNLEKMAQAKIVMDDILKADRKKREQRESAKTADG